MRPWTSAATAVTVASLVTAAHADPLEVGGFFGPRRFADDVVLGADGQGQTSLGTSVVLGPRIARPLLPWLVPELELAISPATTRAFDVSVFWLEPRALVRIELRPGARLRPFFGVGVGMATALSSKRVIYDSGLTVDGFGVAGLGWNPGRGLRVRLDVRVGVLPARADAARPVTVEGEVLLGVHVPLGRSHAAPTARGPERAPTELDRDGDGLADAEDACPDRAEDHDGFEDKDGCPDIDNDLDHVLDISDKCTEVAEVYNGFEDDDGCPDLVPPAVDQVVGTVEGLLYREGEAEVRAIAKDGLDRLAQVLEQNPSVRVILVGHTDDREALPEPAPPPADGAAPAGDPADGEALALELGRARATAVRAALIERGVARGRIVVDSAGAAAPVSDNGTPRGRLRNRRVELRLYIPDRGT
ncbi:MAG: OmpA family protein [Myxococcales bacterium]|nr:OmpA family protein [Myxococcales bacterium]